MAKVVIERTARTSTKRCNLDEDKVEAWTGGNRRADSSGDVGLGRVVVFKVKLPSQAGRSSRLSHSRACVFLDDGGGLFPHLGVTLV